MKFRTKTNMAYATLDEVIHASQQGTLLSTTVQDVTYGRPLSTTLVEQKEGEKGEGEAAAAAAATGSQRSSRGIFPLDDKALLALSAGVLIVGIVSLLFTVMWILLCRVPQSTSASLKEELMPNAERSNYVIT
jgi:hypothetical protein